MSNVAITNRTVKPFIKAHDFYPSFKLEEECFSNAMIKDIDEPARTKKKSKSEIEQGPRIWPREKAPNQRGDENFLEEVINPKTGEFYPEKMMMAGLSRIHALLIT
jgi:hypothetical protein